MNEKALDELQRRRLPGVDAASRRRARSCPFEDDQLRPRLHRRRADPQSAPGPAAVTAEIVRCSRRSCCAPSTPPTEEDEVPYRGQRGALYKRDYLGLYAEHHPELTLIDQGTLRRTPSLDLRALGQRGVQLLDHSLHVRRRPSRGTSAARSPRSSSSSACGQSSCGYAERVAVVGQPVDRDVMHLHADARGAQASNAAQRASAPGAHPDRRTGGSRAASPRARRAAARSARSPASSSR